MNPIYHLKKWRMKAPPKTSHMNSKRFKMMILVVSMVRSGPKPNSPARPPGKRRRTHQRKQTRRMPSQWSMAWWKRMRKNIKQRSYHHQLASTTNQIRKLTPKLRERLVILLRRGRTSRNKTISIANPLILARTLIQNRWYWRKIKQWRLKLVPSW